MDETRKSTTLQDLPLEKRGLSSRAGFLIGGLRNLTSSAVWLILISVLAILLLGRSLTGLGASAQNVPVTSFGTPPGALPQSIAFSPDGRLLAAGTYLSHTGEGVWLWNLNKFNPGSMVTPPPVPLKGHGYAVNSVAFSPDGRTLASGADDQTVRLWGLGPADNAAKISSSPFMVRTRVKSVAFSPDGRLVAAGGLDGSLTIWHLDGLGRPTGIDSSTPKVIEVSQDEVHSVVFSPDGHWLAVASHDHAIYLWESSNLDAKPRKLLGHLQEVRSIAFSPDSRTLASGGYDQAVMLWDMTKQSPTGSILGSCQSTVCSVAFDPDNDHVAAGCENSNIYIWSKRQAGVSPVVLADHRTWVNSVAFSPDGRILASASDDRTVRLWEVNQSKPSPPTPAP